MKIISSAYSAIFDWPKLVAVIPFSLRSGLFWRRRIGFTSRISFFSAFIAKLDSEAISEARMKLTRPKKQAALKTGKRISPSESPKALKAVSSLVETRVSIRRNEEMNEAIGSARGRM